MLERQAERRQLGRTQVNGGWGCQQNACLSCTDKQRTKTEAKWKRKYLNKLRKEKDIKTVISMQQSILVLLLYASLYPLYLSLCAVQIILMEMTSIADSWVAQTWLVIYLSSFPLPFILSKHTPTALWRLKSFFTSSLPSAKLCPGPPIVTVIYCVILFEPIVSLVLQTWQVRVAGKSVQPRQAFVQAWWYLSACKSSS